MAELDMAECGVPAGAGDGEGNEGDVVHAWPPEAASGFAWDSAADVRGGAVSQPVRRRGQWSGSLEKIGLVAGWELELF